MRAEMMARVKGSCMVKRVPAPGMVSASMKPFRRSMHFTTTSRPTPRPLSSVTVSAVEKPSAKMSWMASRSVRWSASPMIPRSRAFRRTSAASIPAPSSAMVITTWFDSWAAESRMVPVADLPLARRSPGLSIPWSTLLRIMWTRGSPSSSMIALSTRVSSPCRISSISFPCWRLRSRTRRGNRSKTFRMGSIRTAMIVSWSWVLNPSHQLTAVSTQLQEAVMDVRMLPIRNVFERFPRLVRDLSRQQGKEIELILEGEETRVDKAIIDEVGQPLVHMIRNSVDHGIERPADRPAKGKAATGTTLLSAAQESNQVVITIADDGAGIDAAEVRRKARERGIIGDADQLTDREAIQLVFTEGFSTAETVTELSGRGVGLDVVVKCMERLNGFIDAETMPGAGTRFTMQLPLTLAIISALMVEVGGYTYAIPAGSVVESLKFRPEEVNRIGGRETLRLRDRIVPLFRLAQLFGHEGRGLLDHSYAVVLGRGDKRLGLAVDRLLGQQEVVIKALDPIVSAAGLGLAGATIMGDGRVVLILDVAGFFGDRRLLGARPGAVA